MTGQQTIAVLIALAVAFVTVTAGATAVVSSSLDAVYEANTDVLVQPIQALMPGEGVTPLSNNEITQTYSRLLLAPSVLAGVIQTLHLNLTVEELNRNIEVAPVGNTTVLQVTVSSNDPHQAASIANTLVDTFIHRMAGVSQGQASVDVVVVSAATAPTAPSSPNVLRNVTVAVILALIALVLITALIRALAGREAARHETATDVQTMGHIPHTPGGSAIEEVCAEGSVADDAYRGLRTNVAAALGAPPFSILVSSWGRKEGRSRTVANLAASFAMSGSRPVIVDADLRSPTQAAIWGSRGPGLAEYLRAEAPASEVTRGSQDVDVVAAGQSRVPDPLQALGSERMRSLPQELRADHDVVILDSPAAGQVSDAFVLSGSVDAVLLVADTDPARHAIEIAELQERFQRAGARVLGVVMNDAFQAPASRSAMGGNPLAVQIRLALDGLGRL